MSVRLAYSSSKTLRNINGWLLWKSYDQKTSALYLPVNNINNTANVGIVGRGHVRPRPTTLLPPRSSGKPKAATVVYSLLIMGMRMPETCWAVFKRQALNLGHWCIWLVWFIWILSLIFRVEIFGLCLTRVTDFVKTSKQCLQTVFLKLQPSHRILRIPHS
jgi:hypothetical protein